MKKIFLLSFCPVLMLLFVFFNTISVQAQDFSQEININAFEAYTNPPTVSGLGQDVATTTASSNRTNTLKDLVFMIMEYLNLFLVLLIAIAVVIFVWYIIQYFIKADAEREKAAPYVMYSIIGFFIILSFWGLVRIMINTFRLPTDKPTNNWTEFIGLFPSK